MKGNSDNSSLQRFTINPSTKIGYVSLNVSEMERSLEFYKSVLGFRTASKPRDEKVLLSVNESPSPLVELIHADVTENHKFSGSASPRRAGLYHFAILLPERKFLADMLQNLSEKRGQINFDGLADHLVSESIYIRDPDHNGIEIYRDRPSSEWKWSGNQVQMATIGLNTKDLLKDGTQAGWKEMPPKTVIGHVHLHVRNLASATRFYSETLGLNMTGTFPGAHFFAAGKYHHHIATNTWLGTNIGPTLPGNIGLNHFSVRLPSKEEFERTVKQLSRPNIVLESDSPSDSVIVQDTDGIRLRINYK